MIFFGSIALSLICVLATIGTLLALPGGKIDPVIGVASALKLGIAGTAEIAALAIARHPRHRSDCLPVRVLAADLRVRPGLPGVYAVAVIGSVGTAAGIYYSFALSWSPDITRGSWMTWVGTITGVSLVAAALVYVFGRRCAGKLNSTDVLAHLAVLESSAAPAA
jgi:hypothetical protein